MRYPIKQQGFSLYMVLIIMAIIAILVLAGGQMINTEMRISSNDADRKYAFSLAEDALKAGEEDAFLNVHRDQVLVNPEVVSALSQMKIDPKLFYVIIGNAGNANVIFDVNCKAGLCAPAMEKAVTNSNETNPAAAYTNKPAWERTVAVSGKEVSIFDTDTNSRKYNLATSANVYRVPHYIIEFLGPSEDGTKCLYRITARSWGKNQNTQVTLQSVIQVDNKR